MAENYGWKPEGTTLDEPEGVSEGGRWSGEYATNDGQRVSATDAAALADASERALLDPDYERRAASLLNDYNAAVAKAVPGYTPEPAKHEDVMRFRDRLTELITFCREGSFIVE